MDWSWPWALELTTTSIKRYCRKQLVVVVINVVAVIVTVVGAVTVVVVAFVVVTAIVVVTVVVVVATVVVLIITVVVAAFNNITRINCKVFRILLIYDVFMARCWSHCDEEYGVQT